MGGAVRRPLLSILAAVAAVGLAHAGAGARQTTRTIYLNAFDNKGSPLPDLQPADLVVKASGKLLEVVRVAPSETPLRITVIVSDAGTGGFQQGVAAFIERLIDRAEFGLVSVLTQPEVVTNFSNDPAVLQAGVRRLGARGRQHGAQVMEAIQEATGAVPSETRRPVIVVLRVGVEGTTPLDGGEVRDRLRRSGALLYVISTASSARQPPPSARTGISTEQAQLHDDEIAASRRNLAAVLDDGARESGGRHDEIVATTIVSPSLERIAEELRHQYAVTCVAPAGVKPSDKLSVTAKRKGVKIQAPARLK
jgi:hypothetical protein